MRCPKCGSKMTQYFQENALYFIPAFYCRKCENIIKTKQRFKKVVKNAQNIEIN